MKHIKLYSVLAAAVASLVYLAVVFASGTSPLTQGGAVVLHSPLAPPTHSSGGGGSVLLPPPPGFQFLTTQIVSFRNNDTIYDNEIQIARCPVGAAPMLCGRVYLSLVYYPDPAVTLPFTFSVILNGVTFAHLPSFDASGPCVSGVFTPQGPYAVKWSGALTCRDQGTIRTDFAVPPTTPENFYPLTVSYIGSGLQQDFHPTLYVYIFRQLLPVARRT